MNKFLILDTETGGLDANKHSLLTLYMAEATLINGAFVIGKELDLKIKPDNSQAYCLTAGAMKVNKIDIVKHDESALNASEASKALYNFLSDVSRAGLDKQIVMGHNPKFDINFITSQLLKESLWNTFTSYHHFDTVSLALMLKIQNKIPQKVNLSLGKLAAHLQIDTQGGEMHTAKHDALITLRAAEKMLAM